MASVEALAYMNRVWKFGAAGARINLVYGNGEPTVEWRRKRRAEARGDAFKFMDQCQWRRLIMDPMWLSLQRTHGHANGGQL